MPADDDEEGLSPEEVDELAAAFKKMWHEGMGADESDDGKEVHSQMYPTEDARSDRLLFNCVDCHCHGQAHGRPNSGLVGDLLRRAPCRGTGCRRRRRRRSCRWAAGGSRVS